MTLKGAVAGADAGRTLPDCRTQLLIYTKIQPKEVSPPFQDLDSLLIIVKMVNKRGFCTSCGLRKYINTVARVR